MAKPRQLLPGTIYHVTRRTLDRRYRLRPTPFCREAALYCLGYAQQQTGIELHAAVFMSNHFHLVLTDPNGELPVFMHLLDLNLAKVMNQHEAYWGPLWEQRQYHRTICADDDAILDSIAYGLANPVTAGLVRNPEDWPGANTSKRRRSSGADPST